MEKTNRGIDTWIYRLAMILIALVLISTWMLTGLSARFTTSAYVDESARVAKFSVDGKIGDDNLWTYTKELTADVAPGSTQMASIQIANNSEVAVAYTIKVTNNTKNLPIYFYVEGDSANAKQEIYTYQSNVQANSNDNESFNLCISWPSSNDEDNLNYIGMVDYITVNVTATQID